MKTWPTIHYFSIQLAREKSPRVGKSTSEDILGGHAYSGQYSILKGCNSQGGAQSFQGGENAPPPPLKETLPELAIVLSPLGASLGTLAGFWAGEGAGRF